MTLIIAGERSGVGKTTVTLALLAFLSKQHQKVQSFKVGPDYIDPMFHQRVTGRPCRNLDPVLTSEKYVQDCFNCHIQGVDYALIEGVMGLFDGASGREDFASTAHIARLLQLPVLLVLDCSKLSGSVAAIANGYRCFDPRVTIAGLVLNRVGSDRHLELLQDALEPLQLPVVGVLRRQDNITIPDRHLGLIPTDELTHLNILIDRLADLANNCFDWQQLLPLLGVTGKHPQSPIIPSLLDLSRNSEIIFERGNRQQAIGNRIEVTLNYPRDSNERDYITKNENLLSLNPTTCTPQPIKVRLAIARDRAFSFYYQDNLDILAQLGAELVFWSPLHDETLPENVQGLYFGGGFPEVFAAQLAENRRVCHAVKQAIIQGMPTYAECGGLMYLSEQIIDFEDNAWSMVGILPTQAIMGKRLTLGYRQATARQDSPLLSAGKTVWGHEFHRSHLTSLPEKPLFEIRGYGKINQDKIVTEGWQIYQLHASYVHLHWGADREIPVRFLRSLVISH